MKRKMSRVWSRAIAAGFDRVVIATDDARVVSVATSLGAEVGDTMALGESRFVIAGTVASFPGDVGVRAAFGPRVFIPSRYLEETGLLGFGSRAEYDWFLRVPEGLDTKSFADTWRPSVGAAQGRLKTAVEEEEDLRQFLDQLGRYLGLVALIALLLGGIGVGSAVQVFIKRKRDTIAVLRCLGATSGQVFGAYLLQAAAMGFLGSLAGVILGLVLQLAMPRVFGAFLPLDVSVEPSISAILTGLGVGVWVALVFALLPLLAVRRVPPLAMHGRRVSPRSCSPQRQSFLGASAEMHALARAEGVTLGADSIGQLEAYIGSLQPDTRSSLLIDLQQGKKIEVEGLLGFAVRLGEKHGVATPIIKALYTVLKPWANGPR